MVAYINNILVTGKSQQGHLENLTRVLNCLEEAGVTLNRHKCAFGALSVEYLGHVINQEGLHPSEEKVRAIKQAPRPRNVTELKSFLGLLNYYSNLFPHLSTLLSPLYHLLRKDGNWSCKKLPEDAFNKAKQLLQSSTLLMHYDCQKEIILSCDAS